MTNVAVKREDETPKESGLTLILDPKSIEKPNFPVQWKFGTEMLERIRTGLANGYGYAVLVVATRDGDTCRHFEVRSVNESLQFLRLVEVPRPGKWTIGVLLFERTDVPDGGQRTTDILCKDIHGEYLSTTRKWRTDESYTKYERTLEGLNYIKTSGDRAHIISRAGWRDRGVVIAKDVKTVEIKPELFPDEPPEWLKTYANYFFGGRMPYDQCNFIWRVVGMCTVGLIPWLLIETAKRVALFALAMVMLLFGFFDWWKVGDAALEGSFNVALHAHGATLKEVDFVQAHGFLRFLMPGFLLLYGGLFKLLAFLWHFVATTLATTASVAIHPPAELGPWFQPILGGVVLLSVLFFNRKKVGKGINDWWNAGRPKRVAAEVKREKERARRTLALGVADATTATTYQQVLTSDKPVEVSLDAVPQALRPKGFTWLSLFKRDHCSPWRYGH